MNAPYLLIPVGVSLILFYSFSLMFSRLGILSRNLHRKFWNYGMLATFLVTAVLGLLMAVQVNYKMEVPWTEKVLKWHVNFGISMSLVGIFHFLWHFNYYFKFPTRQHAGDKSANPEKTADFNQPWVPAFAIGFSGVLVQTVFVREFLTLFQGNELTLSLIFCFWLLLTGSGALAGSGSRLSELAFSRSSGYSTLMIIRSLLILPVILAPLILYLKKLLYAPGIEAGPLSMSFFFLFALLPYCLLNGFAFTWYARTVQARGIELRKIYGWESIGGAAGGIAVTAAILAGLPAVTILLLSASALLFLIHFSTAKAPRSALILPFTIVILAILSLAMNFDKILQSLSHPNEILLSTRSGNTGRISVTQTAGQTNIYENGILVNSSGNVMVNEELAGFSLIQTEKTDHILVIGGLLSGIQDQLNKFSSRRIDFVEMDPRSIRLAERLNLTGPDTLRRLIRKTPSAWLRSADISYDAILVNLPGPQNLQLNRFYTSDFIRSLKKILNPGGVVTLVLPPTMNYVSENAASAISPVVNAGWQHFKHAVVFPGENNYLILTDLEPVFDIIGEIDNRGISNIYVNSGYFDDFLFLNRIKSVNEAIMAERTINTDLRPVAFFNQIRWWLGQFPEKTIIPGSVILALIIVLSLLLGKSGLSAMFFVGAASSGTEILLLFLLQVIAGSVYQLAGLFFGIFMAGLAAGSLYGARLTHRLPFREYSPPLGLLVLFLAVSALIAPWMAGSEGLIWLKILILMILGFAIPVMAGAFFADLSARSGADSPASNRIYGYDLVGSAIGAILFPMVIIPLGGIRTALFALTLCGIISLLFASAGRLLGIMKTE